MLTISVTTIQDKYLTSRICRRETVRTMYRLPTLFLNCTENGRSSLSLKPKSALALHITMLVQYRTKWSVQTVSQQSEYCMLIFFPLRPLELNLYDIVGLDECSGMIKTRKFLSCLKSSDNPWLWWTRAIAVSNQFKNQIRTRYVYDRM